MKIIINVTRHLQFLCNLPVTTNTNNDFIKNKHLLRYEDADTKGVGFSKIFHIIFYISLFCSSSLRAVTMASCCSQSSHTPFLIGAEAHIPRFSLVQKAHIPRFSLVQKQYLFTVTPSILSMMTHTSFNS